MKTGNECSKVRQFRTEIESFKRYELFDAYKKLAVANYGDAKAQEMGQKGALTVRDRNPFDFPAVYREEYYPSFTGAMNGSSVFHRLSPRRKREIADAKMGLGQMTAKKDGRL
jgi:hypothetical protein